MRQLIFGCLQPCWTSAQERLSLSLCRAVNFHFVAFSALIHPLCWDAGKRNWLGLCWVLRLVSATGEEAFRVLSNEPNDNKEVKTFLKVKNQKNKELDTQGWSHFMKEKFWILERPWHAIWPNLWNCLPLWHESRRMLRSLAPCLSIL